MLSEQEKRDLIAEARRLQESWKKIEGMFSETEFLESDSLAELHANGYTAVHSARRLADALEAATEELANAKAGWESALRIVNQGSETIKQLGAERDAALAAIERAKVELEALWIARREPQGPDSWYSGIVHARANVLAALDGAPEPEEKP